MGHAALAVFVGAFAVFYVAVGVFVAADIAEDNRTLVGAARLSPWFYGIIWLPAFCVGLFLEAAERRR